MKKDNLNGGADVENDISKHFAGRLDAVAPKFKSYVSVQKAFFQAVDNELNDVYQQLIEKSNPKSSSGAKKRCFFFLFFW